MEVGDEDEKGRDKGKKVQIFNTPGYATPPNAYHT